MALPTAVMTKSMGVGLCYHSSHCPSCPIPAVGVVINGYPLKTIGGLNAALVGNLVMSGCGHMGVLITGSSTVKVGGIAQSTVTSQFVGDFVGVLITGADNHNTG